MEKKTYTTPEIEVIDIPEQPMLLQTSGGSNSAPLYYDDGEFN
jgi:hypothetical protein